MVPHQMWVADITDECILGLDFLEKFDCQICLKDRVLVMGNQQIPLTCSSSDVPQCYRIIAKESCTVEPWTEAIVPGQVINKGHGRWGVVGDDTNSNHLKFGLLVGRCLVDLGNDTVPVRVLNPSAQEYRVAKGTDLSSCEQVVSVLSVQDGEDHRAPSNLNTKAVRKSTRDLLPSHLKDLITKSTERLEREQQDKALELLMRFSDVFSQNSEDLGRTNLVQHRITTGEAAPIRQPPRRLPLSQREEAKTQVEKLLKHGIIEESSSPWASPIVLVQKKDGSFRFCVDYRKLNSVTKKDSYPLPRIDNSLETLADSKWFSTLDLRSGYWQVGVDPHDKEKTAFSTGQGLWQFTVMPFGLCNAPATFERLMEQVFRGLSLDVCLLYLDDILVPGKTFDHHLDNLTQVLQ